MVHRESLTQIGLRAEKNVAKHLLAENGWESSLVADVSKVDYLEGHLGRTQLQRLRPSSKRRSRVGSKALASHIWRRRLRKTNSVGHFQPVRETVGGAYKTPSCCTPF